MNDEVAEAIALVVITALIAYVSIVLGELTAKRLALQRAESCALALAPLVDLTASVARPVIWLLGTPSSECLVATRRRRGKRSLTKRSEPLSADQAHLGRRNGRSSKMFLMLEPGASER